MWKPTSGKVCFLPEGAEPEPLTVQSFGTGLGFVPGRLRRRRVVATETHTDSVRLPIKTDFTDSTMIAGF